MREGGTASAAARPHTAGVRADLKSAAEFGEWVRPYWADMHRLARRLCGTHNGDDVVQEALSAAWRKRGQFDAVRGTPRVWLLAIVADQAYKHHRSRRHTIELTEDVAEATSAGDLPTGMDVAAAIRRLSRRQQVAITLHYYVGLPVAETAEVMSCSAGTVKSTLSDARTRLRELLGEDYTV